MTFHEWWKETVRDITCVRDLNTASASTTTQG